MEDELKRAESILNAYLSFSKPYDEEQETILITKQLREIVEIMTPYSQLNNVELHLHKNEKADQLRFIANKVEFNQVFINIIKNGVESIKENGQIDITVEHEKRDIKISIKDTGVGMDKEQLDKLFNFYYSKKKDGTGIGLAVCNHIIQSFRGRIKVKSEEGKGAEFIILLPYD
jgi:two-component system sporulation sensor kinase B